MGWQRPHNVSVEQPGHDVGGGLIPGWDEVAIGAKGHRRILTKTSGDRDDIHSGAEQLGGDVMPKVVEAYRDFDRLRRRMNRRVMVRG